MHNLFATGLFSAGLSPKATDTGFNQFTPFGNAYSVHFITKMNIFELEGMWHLRDYAFREGKNSRLVPTLGISLGVFQYTPYRYAYKNQRNDQTYAQYKAWMNENYLFNLRDFGSEGQNFLPGAKPYSQISTSVGSSFSVEIGRAHV